MAIRSVPALVAVGLVVLGGFAATKVASVSFGFPGEVRRGENVPLKAFASPVSTPDSGSGIVVVTVPVGSGPYGVGYNSRNGYVYVANEGSTTVTVINGTTIVATVPVGSEPGGVAYDSGNGYVYVANSAWFSNSVSVISGSTVVATIPVGTNPWDVAYHSGNGYVYVANAGSNNVSVIDGTAVVATVPVESSPISVGYNSGNGYIYVANQGSNNVSVIDGTAVVATVPVGTSPEGVGYNSGNGYVYVANFYSNTVSVINGTTVVATIPVGDYPFDVGYNSGNGDVYVSSIGSGNLTVIEGTTVVGTVAVGGAPHGIAYDAGNGYVYVANFASDTVSVFSTIVPPLVTFTETGLPSGTSWSVTLESASNSSATTTIMFSVPNGTYAYVVRSVFGYAASPSTGSVTVNGAPVQVAISFSVTTYAVTFTETGLPSGTWWSVTLDGASNGSATATIGFSAPNGTYTYAIGSVFGYAASPVSGSVTVNGTPVNIAISFSVTTYAVIFTETGLPRGTSWSVTLGGTTQNSTADKITFMEPNGTYTFSVSPVAGYEVSRSSGSVSVSGKAANESVSFTALFLGLPAMEGFALLAGIMIVLVAVGVVLALRWVKRKRRVPRTPPP